MWLSKLALVAFVLAAAPVCPAAVLFSEKFDQDHTGDWKFNSPTGDAADDAIGNEANFYFDYSTVGIPQAPSGGSTRGLKMEANVPGTGVFTGMSASPLNQSFSGDFILRADVWQNFNGPFPAGGSGSTQMTWAGIGTNGTTAQFPGTSVQGVGFAASGDGGTATDYRVYTNVGAPLAPTAPNGGYAAGTQATAQNNSDPYYAAHGFGNKTAPPAQLGLFSQQSGATAAGTQGMAWHVWEITKTGNLVTWTIDGVPIGSVDVTNEPFGGDNIFVGHFDIQATSSLDPNARDLLFGLVDNVEVSEVPEPAALSLLAIGGIAGLLRRRGA
jgi:hypothetical protein